MKTIDKICHEAVPISGEILYMKDLLLQCSAKSIVEVIMDREKPASDQRDSTYAAYFRFVNDLKSIQPSYSDEDIVFGLWLREDGEDYPFLHLYSKKEIEEQFAVSEELDCVSDIGSLSEAELGRLLHIASASLPQHYDFELSPWADILGFQVDPENVREFGAARLIGLAVCEMTFSGFSEDTNRAILECVEQQLLELNADQEESDWDEEPEEPEEEQEDCMESEVAERMPFNDFANKEKHCSMWCDYLYSRLQGYRALKKYCYK